MICMTLILYIPPLASERIIWRMPDGTKQVIEAGRP